MGHYSVKTKLDPEAVISKATAYFSGELGLAVEEQTSCSATFAGGGGFVTVSAAPAGGKTEVTLQTREWEYQVRAFMRQIT